MLVIPMLTTALVLGVGFNLIKSKAIVNVNLLPIYLICYKHNNISYDVLHITEQYVP